MKETIIVRRTLGYWVCRGFCRLLVAKYCRTTVTGLENIPKTGPAYLVSNHASDLDPPVIGGNIGRYISFVAKQELFDGRLGFLFRQFGAIPFRRGALDRRPLVMSKQQFEAGNLVALFPEGTRSQTGLMQEFKAGFGMIAVKYKVPIIPIGLIGTENVMPPGAKRPRRARLGMNIGKPIPWDTPDLEAVVTAEVRRLANQ